MKRLCNIDDLMIEQEQDYFVKFQNRTNLITLEDEKLITSMISKTEKSNFYNCLINKLACKFLKITINVLEPIVTNQRLMRIISVLERSVPKPNNMVLTPAKYGILVDAFSPIVNKQFDYSNSNPFFIELAFIKDTII